LLAYIGPGAGFAFMGSFLVLLLGAVLTVLAILLWPIRFLFGLLRFHRRPGRVVIIGLDGLDARRCRRLMDEDKLPAFSRLERLGAFRPLESTCPPISPVAWSSFMTGVNPGKHRIFDFLNRDMNTYLPELSSVRTRSAGGRSGVTLRRRSRPFWAILGEHGVFSSILRVPVTYPPEKFRGLCLSGMCTPDIRGSQGTFTWYTDCPENNDVESGRRIPVAFDAGEVRTFLPGPLADGRDGKPELTTPLRIRVHDDRSAIVLNVSGNRIRLRAGEYSDWAPVRFGRICGICRFYFSARRDRFLLYASPVNIDPERPAMPISHPVLFSRYLARLIGPFATLGIPEDTWARSGNVLDDRAYLKQVYDIHGERERMCMRSLECARNGLLVCVFDAPDRVQHMFTRTTTAGEIGVKDAPETAEKIVEKIVDDVYASMDRLVGRVHDALGRRDTLIVMSDHGFSRFERGVNLNAWLRSEGYLTLAGAGPEDTCLRKVHWPGTRAYSFGLSGIYVNRKGREGRGTVEENDAEFLVGEISEKLLALRDGARKPIHRVYNSRDTYSGPYRDDGPDIIVGFAEGYRASWESAQGKTAGPVFSDNTKAWSGDHCVDRDLVPGVFFCNRGVDTTRAVSIMDIAPTVLSLFGVRAPSYMDGNAIRISGQPVS
jgi:predicted AlkP superfamily phosphohydrolase/phosphomutase